jgi:integrase
LRHSFNSMLLNSGVGEDLRMRLSGHASTEMNRRYSHAEVETLRAAVAKLPRINA